MHDESKPQRSEGPDGKGGISLSVFFPCYNEEANVRAMVEKAFSVLEGLEGADYEVIVVNDGSADRTGDIADELARGNDRLKVIHHPENLGYGAALRSGFKAASKKLVFYTDGDGQFDLGEMPSFLPLMKEYDLVTGYRLNRRDNLLRRINGWCWTRLSCLLFGLKIRDMNCAFKMYRKEIFDRIELSSDGALIDAEVLARAARHGFTITEKGVHHYPRTAGEQTGAHLGVILRAFLELFKLYRTIRKEG